MQGVLDIRLLGEPMVLRDGRALALPPSKKTRALLAYLALTGRAHRRERLCSLLWDVTDDPRAALRWSLTKLREVVDTESDKRLVATRESVQLELTRVRVDALEARQLLRGPIEEIATPTLEAALELFRGELLEGLDLPEFHGYHAFCVAEREALRQLSSRALSTLLTREKAQPERALRLSRQLLEIEPQNAAVRAQFMELLHRSGRAREAEAEARTSKRLLSSGPLATAHQERAEGQIQVELPQRVEPSARLIGRTQERAQIAAAFTGDHPGPSVALLEAEAGVGKTRLLQAVLAEFCSRADPRASTPRAQLVLSTTCAELSPGSPYAAWLSLMQEALKRVDDAELAQLLSELAREPAQGDSDGMRARIFHGVAGFLSRALEREKALLIVLDDAHWLDEGSAALLGHVLETSSAHPLFVLLAARPGALADNLGMLRVLRGVRRRGVLEEISLAPLDAAETRELLLSVASSADPERVYRESAGNALFALELSRSAVHSEQGVPLSIARVVRDRLCSLPAEVADALRWASLLGTQFELSLLDRLLALSGEAFVAALEQLEQHGWLAFEGKRASFSHQIVRSAIYDGLSGPRRALMHSKVARLYSEAFESDGARAAELARHSALGGDHAMAARACVAAGRRCLRLGARADAQTLARMGLSYVDEMSEPERTTISIELLDLSVVSHRPDAEAKFAERLTALSARAAELGAVEHARRAMFLRVLVSWEDGHAADAERFTREVERISRKGSPRERMSGLGDAARCLVSLERDLPEAEALVVEAETIAEQAALDVACVAMARAALHVYRGEFEAAETTLVRAAELSRGESDRLCEMHALEHRLEVAFSRRDYAGAERISLELLALGEKSREGSEVPFAQAAHELARYGSGASATMAAFDQAVIRLEQADAKRRSAALLTYAAELAVSQGLLTAAQEKAERAAQLAREIGRPSDVALALSVLVSLARLAPERDVEERLTRELTELAARPLSGYAAAKARTALAHKGPPSQQGANSHGTRHRRTRLR
jgi:DNA-binding SARP family transcriptional activator